MKLEDHVRDAIREELKRQAEASSGQLQVAQADQAVLRVQGPVNVDDLVMAVTGSLAGGP